MILLPVFLVNFKFQIQISKQFDPELKNKLDNQ